MLISLGVLKVVFKNFNQKNILELSNKKNQFKKSNIFLTLTAGYVEGAGLLVQGEKGELHGAGTGDGDPRSSGILGLLTISIILSVL